MAGCVWYGIMQLKRMQADYDRRAPVKHDDAKAKE
jgi:hypothetical protein